MNGSDFIKAYCAEIADSEIEEVKYFEIDGATDEPVSCRAKLTVDDEIVWVSVRRTPSEVPVA